MNGCWTVAELSIAGHRPALFLEANPGHEVIPAMPVPRSESVR